MCAIAFRFSEKNNYFEETETIFGILTHIMSCLSTIRMLHLRPEICLNEFQIMTFMRDGFFFCKFKFGEQKGEKLKYWWPLIINLKGKMVTSFLFCILKHIILCFIENTDWNNSNNTYYILYHTAHK